MKRSIIACVNCAACCSLTFRGEKKSSFKLCSDIAKEKQKASMLLHMGVCVCVQVNRGMLWNQIHEQRYLLYETLNICLHRLKWAFLGFAGASFQGESIGYALITRCLNSISYWGDKMEFLLSQNIWTNKMVNVRDRSFRTVTYFITHLTVICFLHKMWLDLAARTHFSNWPYISRGKKKTRKTSLINLKYTSFQCCFVHFVIWYRLLKRIL